MKGKMMFKDLSCKMFIHTDKKTDEFVAHIEEIVRVKCDEFRTFENDYFAADVLLNKWYDEHKHTVFPDGFLYYKYLLKFECIDKNKEKDYIAFLHSFMSVLWEMNMKVVAACDFEEKLPRHGGYGQQINYS
ncbi:MAG: hypothetical protein FWE25_08985 [Lachnospiraceae bacterium]|nr:hypothetical protein [Lachnospiraceae bacterium]